MTDEKKIKKIPFPRYTREEDLRCELTDKHINEIRLRRAKGESYGQIAKDYSVSPQTILL